MIREVVLDACVLIQYVESEHPLHEETVDYLSQIDAPLVVNNVTLSEVLVGAEQAGIGDSILSSIIDDLGARVFDGIGSEWAMLVAQTRANSPVRIKVPDAIGLATALTIGGLVATHDKRLAKAAASEDALYSANDHMYPAR